MAEPAASLGFGPDQRSVDYLRRRITVPSAANSAQWERFPVALREAAFFSSTVTSAQLLGSMHQDLGDMVAQIREQTPRGEAVLDRRTLVSKWKQKAIDEGLTPPEGDRRRGTIEDITSIPRLNLIYTTQTQRAEGYATYLGDLEPGALEEFPAQELVRLEERRIKRHWHERWRAAGGRIFGGSGLDGREGRMIALKGDPVWSRISRFGTPWAPFDFGSGVGIADVDRQEAETLGLIQPGETPKATAKDFTAEMQASAESVPSDIRDEMKSLLGDQVTVSGDKVRWTAAPDPEPAPAVDPGVFGADVPQAIESLVSRAAAEGIGTPIQDTIRSLPPQLAPHLADLKLKAIPPGSVHGPHYRRSTRTISLGTDPTQHEGQPDVIRHEIGHHLHFELGAVTDSGPSAAMLSAMREDLASWRAWAKARHGDQWERVWRLSPAARQDAARAIFGEDYFGLSKEQKMRVVRFTDAVQGLSRGRYGSGHSRAYQKENGPEEAFANSFAALLDGDKFFTALLPNVHALIKRLANL